MSRIPAVPVEVCFEGRWYRGTLRSCEVPDDGSPCSGIVSFKVPHGVQTRRFSATHLRSLAGTPGCPASRDDSLCLLADPAHGR